MSQSRTPIRVAVTSSNVGHDVKCKRTIPTRHLERMFSSLLCCSQFQLIYRSGGVEHFSRFFHDVQRNKWQHLALIVCPRTGVVHVYLDCLRIFETKLKTGMDCFAATPQTEEMCLGSWPFVVSDCREINENKLNYRFNYWV